jgi:hypothetical protein
LHIQKIRRQLRAGVAAQAAETLSMGPASGPAEEFAATVGMHHRRPLHANNPPMHATPMLTWCCCGKARATKEQQMIAHALKRGKAAQVNISGVCNQHYACSIQQCRW